VADTKVALGSIQPATDGAYEIDGERIQIPVRVQQAKTTSATFLVDADAAQSVIEHTRLTVDRKRRNKAIVALALIKYAECDLGDYHELALSFVVSPPPGSPPAGKGEVSTYIHRLPVDQEFTCEGGRGIWGFPKWVANLTCDHGAGQTTGVLKNDDGSDLVSLRLRQGPIRVPSRDMTMTCFSNDDEGRILRTLWTTHNKGTRLRFGGAGADVTIGHGHALADELRTLGFPRPPLMTMHVENMSATFDAPTIVG
jgi:hypothetical protein